MNPNAILAYLRGMNTEASEGYEEYIGAWTDEILDEPSFEEMEVKYLKDYYGEEYYQRYMERKDGYNKLKERAIENSIGIPGEGKNLKKDADDLNEKWEWKVERSWIVDNYDKYSFNQKNPEINIQDIVRLNQLNKAAGYPGVDIKKFKEGEVPRSAIHYNPFTHTMQITEESLPSEGKRPEFGEDVVPELTHAFQFTKQWELEPSEVLKEVFNNIPYQLEGAWDFFKGASPFETGFEDVYKTEGTLEHEAHSRIEPSLFDYIYTGAMHKFVDEEGEYIDEMLSFDRIPSMPEWMESLGLPVETITKNMKNIRKSEKK